MESLGTRLYIRSMQIKYDSHTDQTSTNLVDSSQGLAKFMEDGKPTELKNCHSPANSATKVSRQIDSFLIL